nr:sulfatase-like hydrolase/transferase [Thalassobius sp. Cn5-15]
MLKEAPRNFLFIVIDQFRADLLTGALGRNVPLPNMRALAARSVHFRNHHTVVVPCGPARASLLTGQHAMNHGSVQNGIPLRRDMPNLATALRTIGRELLLFGYTDTQPDPRGLHPNDPAHLSYTGPIAGITEVTEMREEAWEWLAHLRSRGYDVPDAGGDLTALYRPQNDTLGGPALYDAQDSDTAYLTDRVLAHLDVRKSQPWSAMVTYIRPHPPFVAPAPYNDLIKPQDIPPPVEAGFEHPFFEAYHSGPSGTDMFWGFDGQQSAITPEQIALCRATYLGLAAEVDHHIGRLFEWLRNAGQMDDTLIVLTADHGEMLGDLGLWGKQTPFRAASHVPLMIGHPDLEPEEIDALTQSIDVAPTVLSALGAAPPFEMQGSNLLAPDQPYGQAAMVELELGSESGQGRFETAWQCPSDHCRALAFEKDGYRLAHFATDIEPMLFDVEKDPNCTQNLASGEQTRTHRLQAEALSYRMRKSRSAQF